MVIDKVEVFLGKLLDCLAVLARSKSGRSIDAEAIRIDFQGVGRWIEVGGLVDNSANIDPETIDQEKVQKALHDAKNLDAQQFQNQELLDMLNVFQNESGPNIDEIAKRLANLKSKVESNEVSD